MGCFESLLQTPGRELGYCFFCQGHVLKPMFNKFSVVFLFNGMYSPLSYYIENSSTQNTRLIEYFSIVSMNFFEL